MSKLVKYNSPFFRLLLTTSSKLQRKALIDTITKDQLRALTEITINLLQGILSLSPVHKSKLRKHRKLIRLIGDKSISLKTKKKSLCRQTHVVTLLLQSVEPSLKTFWS